MGHILVDFDRTLAFYESWEKSGRVLGHPIPAMVERVRRWLDDGLEVRIFTARASESNPNWREDTAAIQRWCVVYLGTALPVTNQKDFETVAIWDDLAVTVESNTGWRWSSEISHKCPKDPLTYEEEAEFCDIAAGRKEYAPLKKEKWVYEPKDEEYEAPNRNSNPDLGGES